MFYVVYRGDAPTFKINASVKMFKTRELAAAYAEAYPPRRNAVVVEGPECLLPGGAKITMPDQRIMDRNVEAKDLLSYVERLVEDGSLEEAVMVIRFSSPEIRREVVLLPEFRPLMFKLVAVM